MKAIETELREYANSYNIKDTVEYEVSELVLNTEKFEKTQEMFKGEEINQLILDHAKSVPNVESASQKETENGHQISLYERDYMNSVVKNYFENYKLLFLKFFDIETNKFYMIGDYLAPVNISYFDLIEVIKQRHIDYMNSEDNQVEQSQFNQTEHSPGIKIALKYKSKAAIRSKRKKSKALEKLGAEFRVVL